MKHIRMFEDSQSATQVLSTLPYNTISSIRGESGVAVNPGVPPDPKSIPFYIDVRGSVTLYETTGLQMSTDKTNWTNTKAVDLPTGKTYFRVASDQSNPLKPDWIENDNSDYDIGGNINSLVKEDFKEDTTCYRFYISYKGIFKNKAKLKSAGNLILPATTLISNCYQSMFEGCTSLTTAPALSATTLASGCYNGMFSGCTSLTTAPALSATTLISNCYQSMFSGCTSLTTAPALSATTLANSCYKSMFSGCTHLTIAPTLPATTLANDCYSFMFERCSLLTTAPTLPATTLVKNCYNSMFSYCSTLKYIKCLATEKLDVCTSNWVQYVSTTGTFVKAPSMTWQSGTAGVPNGWTIEDAA